MYFEKGYAIIGIGCRFPGGITSLDSLWKVLADGVDVVSTVPPERFDLTRYWHPDRNAPGRTCAVAAGITGDITEFDAKFFGMSPKEAEALDPQQRMVLEMAWEAFEDAGIRPSAAAGSRSAVYIGAASTDMGMIHADDPAVTNAYSMTGTSLSIIANRLSYFFDLHGPSMTIDTACSSSLVALNEALRAMEADDIPMALVGGVNVLLSPMPFIGFSKAHMLSEDGRCRVFDADGKGYVRSEGGAVILVKPLDAALRDGDPIHAVIRAAGVNSDGRTSGIALPNGQAQRELLSSIYDDPKIDRSRLAYVEAHGTGTAAGDPIETKSIGEVLGRRGQGANPLLVGSVKANLGHLETGSGMAGLAKVLTVFEHRAVPPNILLQTPNPKIDFEGLGIAVPRTVTPLPSTAGAALAGLNSFGFGGTNAHVLLEEYVEKTPAACCPLSRTEFLPLRLSAQSAESLKEFAGTVAKQLESLDAESFNRKVSALARQRERFAYTLIVRPQSAQQAAAALEAYARTGELPDAEIAAADHSILSESRRSNDGRARTAFVFSGNGSQWAGMGSELIRNEPRFAQAVDEIDAYFVPLAGWSLRDYFMRPAADWDLELTEISQPLLFAVQVALTQMLRSDGVEADAVCGHSVGEVAAAWACGALSLLDAVKVIYQRSKLQGSMKGSGTMAAVKLSEERLRELLTQTSEIEIAAFNAPDSFTLSGSVEALNAFEATVKSESKGLFKRLDLQYAFHSSRMDPLKDDILGALSDITPQSGSARFASSVKGGLKEGGELEALYWWMNIREPVRFEAAVEALLNEGVTHFIEIGPHSILTGYVRSKAKKMQLDVRLLTIMRRGGGLHDWKRAETALLAAWPELSVWPKVPRDRTLPHYPWNKKRFWAEPTAECWRLFQAAPDAHPLLGRPVPHAKASWESVVDLQSHTWLAGHEIDQTAIFPAACFLECALQAAKRALKPERSVELLNIAILRPLALSTSPAKVIDTQVSSSGVIQLSSRDELSQDEPLLHLTGRVSRSDTQAPQSIDLAAADRMGEALDVKSFYDRLSRLGLAYKGAFRPIAAARKIPASNGRKTDDILLTLVSQDAAADVGMALPPALADGALQGLFFAIEAKIAASPELSKTAGDAVYLPSWFGRTIVFADGAPARALIRLERLSERSAKASFVLYDAMGRALAKLCDVRYLRVHRKKTSLPAHFYRDDWIVSPIDRKTAEPHFAFNDAPSTIKALEDAARLVEFTPGTAVETHELLKGFVISHVFEAVSQKDKWTPTELLFTGSDLCCNELEPFSAALKDILLSSRLAEEHDGMIFVPSSGQCPPSDIFFRAVLSGSPEMWPVLTQIDLIAKNLRGILTGDVHLNELVPKSSATLSDMMNRLPQTAASQTALCRIVADAVRETRASGRVRPNILVVLPQADAFVGRLSFAVGRDADITVALEDAKAFERARSAFSGSAAVSAMMLTALEGTPAESDSRYDIVLAPEGLSFLRDIHQAVVRIHSMMLPGAELLLVEEEPNPVADFIFGADPSWWSEQTGGRRSGRLANISAWTKLFNQIHMDVNSLGSKAFNLSPKFVLCAIRPNESGVKSETLAEQRTVTSRRLAIYKFKNNFVGDWSTLLCENIEVKVARSSNATPVISVEIDPEDAEDVQMWKRRICRQGPDSRIILLLDGKGFPSPVLALYKAVLAAVADGEFPKNLEIVAVTGPVAGLGAAADDSAQAIVGLTRVMVNESDSELIRTLSICDATDETIERAADVLLTVSPSEPHLEAGTDKPIRTDEVDAETAVVNGRLHHHLVSLSDRVKRMTINAAQPVRLTFDMPGRLERLYWENLSLPEELAPDEVRVAVYATGLNFRDVMWAMGMLPEEALENGFSGPTMGLEASGRVIAVGREVTRFVPGDDVIAFAPACFSTVVSTSENAVAKKPESLSFAQAASIPVAFFTSWYAIVHLARARRGESILIHGAAGGAGLAAVQIASLLGLEVYATAGTDSKRLLLKRLGVKHVYSSRSLAFADQIRRDTQRRGVDIVFNSLAGDGAEKSLALLAPFGRFLELGKRDFYADTPMFLRPFRRNISYFGIDVDQLLVDQPETARDLFAEVLEHFNGGDFWPLPLTVFDASRVCDAFQMMQASQHIGKIVVAYERAVETDQETNSTDRSSKLNSTESRVCGDTVVITGGLGGLGRQTARRMVEQGARGLILLSRRIDESAQEFASELESLGTRVRLLAVDISTDCGRLINELEDALDGLPPVSLIIHAAGVIADSMISNLSDEACSTVWAPKVSGARNLLAFAETLVARGGSAPKMVFFSSATVLLGNPGQANYVAANAALEAVAENARDHGIPASVIGWGPVGDVGMLATNENARKMLETTLGTPPLSSDEVLDALVKVINDKDLTSSHYFAIEWNRVRRLAEVQTNRFKLIWKETGEAVASGRTVAEILADKNEEQAVAVLVECVAAEVAKLMGVAVSELNLHQPVSDIGMDSLMVAELAVALEERIGLKIPAVSLSGGATILTIAERFAKMLGKSNGDEELDTLASKHGVQLSDDVKQSVLAEVEGK